MAALEDKNWWVFRVFLKHSNVIQKLYEKKLHKELEVNLTIDDDS